MSRVTIAIPALASGVAATALLTGCSAGQITQTATQVAAVPGVNENIAMTDGNLLVGNIGLRDLMIQYKEKGYSAGASAPLIVRIFNDSPQPVRLCAVASEAGEVSKGAGAIAAPATSAATPSPSTTAGSPAATASAVPSVTPSAVPSAETSGSATPSPSRPAASATPRPSASAAGTASSNTACPLNIEVPAAGYRMLLPTQGEHLRIDQLKEELKPGETVPVVFSFLDAAGKQWRTESFNLPMGLPNTPLPRVSSDIKEAEGH